MVFISQPRSVANGNHWAVGSYTAKYKIIEMAVRQASGSFRELQLAWPRSKGGFRRRGDTGAAGTARGEQAPLSRTSVALRRWSGASIRSVACSIARTREPAVAGNAPDRNMVPLRGRSRMSGYDSDQPPK